MNGFDWNLDESIECIGTQAFWTTINNFIQKYKTQIVLTHVPQNYQTNLDKYCVEVWYNFDSMCRVINGYTLEYNEPDEQVQVIRR